MSHIRLAKRTLIGITPVVLALVFASCIFSPHKDPTGGGPPPPGDYLQPINPSSVLENLQKAYNSKDSVKVGEVYDINYQGTSFDPDVPGQIAVTRQDEIRHVQRLYEKTSISVNLQFPPIRIRETDLSDPPGWTTIRLQNMSLQVNDPELNDWILLPTETWEFKFLPHAPDSTSPTDTTWKIVRWTELP